MASVEQVARRLREAGSVFAEDEAALLLAEPRGREDREVLAQMIRRRCEGEPLEHVVGWAAFCGLSIAVGPGVFVPRPRTQWLARRAAALAAPGDVVVDLCCGSGAIGASVATAVGGIEPHAADIDSRATAFAQRNLAPLGGSVHTGDLFDALPRELGGRVAVLVANVPYVPAGEVALQPAEARLHEPLRSLDGGLDGLKVMRRVAAGAARWLRPGGVVLSEVAEPQVQAAVAHLRAVGLDAGVTRDEDLDAVVVEGRR